MIPDTGPRWYETPLWFAAQAGVYAVVVTVLRAVLPDEVGPIWRSFLAGALLVVTCWGAVATRASLHRRDA